MILIIIAALVVIADQITKIIVQNNLPLGKSIPVIPGFFYLTYLKNKGAAFGIFPGFYGVFILITLIVVLLILFYYRLSQPRNLLLKVGLGLTLGGSLGNLIDRLRDGMVTDFLDFRFWPVFNLADSFLVFGLFLIILSYFKMISPGGNLNASHFN